MKTGKLRVFFLGSGRIAVQVIDALSAASSLEVVGVATQPDRQGGRGRKLIPTPVGQWAETRGVAIDKPSSVNDGGFLERLRLASPEMIFLVAFGQILKSGILALPPLGCVNLHASLLPRYRGASPVAAAILAGDPVAGVSFMKMEAGLDSGPVYLRREISLTGKGQADQLEDKLGVLAAEIVCDTLLGVASGSLVPVPQDHAKATYAGKIAKESGLVDWRKPAVEIERLVRAYHPWPGACCEVRADDGRHRRVRIVAAAVRDDLAGEPGTVVTADAKGWVVACGASSLELLRVVPEGKKEMGGSDFLRGMPIRTGSRLGLKNEVAV